MPLSRAGIPSGFNKISSFLEVLEKTQKLELNSEFMIKKLILVALDPEYVLWIGLLNSTSDMYSRISIIKGNVRESRHG